jgi:hypothetical protein
MAGMISHPMARFVVDGDQLVLRLSWLERLAAFRGDVRVPLSAVRAVEVERAPWSALRGMRAPGAGFPGVIAYGVRRLGGARPDFAAILGGRPAVRVELDSPSSFARLLVSVENVTATTETIRRPASIEAAASPREA